MEPRATDEFYDRRQRAENALEQQPNPARVDAVRRRSSLGKRRRKDVFIGNLPEDRDEVHDLANPDQTPRTTSTTHEQQQRQDQKC